MSVFFPDNGQKSAFQARPGLETYSSLENKREQLTFCFHLKENGRLDGAENVSF